MTKNQTAYTIEAYEFKTSERLAADIEKAIEICNNLNIPISKSIEFRPSLFHFMDTLCMTLYNAPIYRLSSAFVAQ